MKTAVLLIHGFLTGPDDWDLFVPALKERYDEVAVFCQPGHTGVHGKPRYKDFTAARVFESLDEAVQALASYDALDVVGHSMGGGMALVAAAQAANIRRAVLLAPAFRYPHLGSIARKNASVRRLRRLAKDCADPVLSEALTEAAKRVSKTFRQGTKAFRTRLFPHWSPHNLLTFSRIMKRCERAVPNVRCPIAVLWGVLDEFVPAKAADVVLDGVESEDVQTVVYADMGHGLLYEGNVPAVLRDVLAVLDGEDVCDVTPAPAEFRTATHTVDGMRTVARHWVSKDSDGVCERTSRKTEQRRKNKSGKRKADRSKYE